MSNVTQLFGSDKEGEQSWAICGKDNSVLAPLFLKTNQGQLIIALVCPECQSETPIENGYAHTTTPKEG